MNCSSSSTDGVFYPNQYLLLGGGDESDSFSIEGLSPEERYEALADRIEENVRIQQQLGVGIGSTSDERVEFVERDILFEGPEFRFQFTEAVIRGDVSIERTAIKTVDCVTGTLGLGGTGLAYNEVSKLASSSGSASSKMIKKGTPRGARSISESTVPTVLTGPTDSVVSSTLKPNVKILGGAGVLMLTGLGLFWARNSYLAFVDELTTSIVEVFQAIDNDQMLREVFVTRTGEVHARKTSNLIFNRLFESFHPTPTVYLSLARGLALDANGQSAHAQEHYEKALACTPPGDIRHRHLIYYLHGRSCRLLGDEVRCRQLIGQIEEDSPFHFLGQIEINGLTQRYFDDQGIPYRFKCLLTRHYEGRHVRRAMDYPVYYLNAEGRRIYFEYHNLVRWLRENNNRCPINRTIITPDQIIADIFLRERIYLWRQTRLKHE